MGAPFLMTALALVQSAWVVDEAPLVTPPWTLRAATAVNDEWIAVVAEAPDAGSRHAVFAVSPTRGSRLLLESRDVLSHIDGNGTGVAISLERDGGSEVLRFKVADGEPSLVSLGQFGDRTPGFVTCDDAVKECLLDADPDSSDGTAVAPVLWRNGERTPLWSIPAAKNEEEDPDSEFKHDLEVFGAALRPTGGVVALAMTSSAAVLDLATGRFVLVREKFQQQGPSLAAVMKTMRAPGVRRQFGHSAGCRSAPQGWNEGRVIITTAGAEIGADDCAMEFELDPKTLKRSPLPPYPWKVLDCPQGGWTSSAGTFVTECIDHVTAMLHGTFPRRPEADGAEPELPLSELSEAMALSETQIFVMAAKGKSTWRWHRGAPKGKGLEFVLHGPSVLTFGKKGVVVEELASWKYGAAIFEAPLLEDWHLVRAAGSGEPRLLRLRDDQVR